MRMFVLSSEGRGTGGVGLGLRRAIQRAGLFLGLALEENGIRRGRKKKEEEGRLGVGFVCSIIVYWEHLRLEVVGGCRIIDRNLTSSYYGIARHFKTLGCIIRCPSA
jgi:hypothetical protein